MPVATIQAEGMYIVVGDCVFYGSIESRYLVAVAADNQTAYNIACALVQADKCDREHLHKPQ